MVSKLDLMIIRGMLDKGVPLPVKSHNGDYYFCRECNEEFGSNLSDFSRYNEHYIKVHKVGLHCKYCGHTIFRFEFTSRDGTSHFSHHHKRYVETCKTPEPKEEV
jgi:hypothetical protein